MSCLIEMYLAGTEDNKCNFELTSKWNSNNNSELRSIEFGCCNAGGTIESDFLFWYNRSGLKRVSDLYGVRIYIEQACAGMDIFERIEFLCSFCVDGKWTPYQPFNDGIRIQSASSTMHSGMLSGAVNAGMHSNTRNYAKIRLKANVSQNSWAGQINFKLTISIQDPKELQYDLH